MSVVKCVLASGLALALAAPAPAGAEWSLADGLGGDTDRDGIVDGAHVPSDAAVAHPSLRVRATGASCDSGDGWQLDGRPVSARRTGPCEFVLDAVTPGPHRVGHDGSEQTVTDRLLVSIGDSVASGEGNPDRRADMRRARWLQRRCHRSMRAGQAQAALALDRRDAATAVTFVTLGCSGATIPRGLLGEYRGIEPDSGAEPAQVTVVNALAQQRELDALLVTIGANDVHFGDIVQFCAAVSRCYDRPFDARTPRKVAADPEAPTLDETVTAALTELAGRYDDLDGALSPRIARERVLISEYFDPTTGADGRFCSLDLGIGRVLPDESEWAHRRVVTRLNAVIAAAAQRHGWTLVAGVDEAFAEHGICQSAATARWVRTPAQSFFRQDALPAFTSIAGTMHPNGRGHLATAELIRAKLASVLGSVSTEPPPTPREKPDGEDDLLGPWTITVIVSALIVVLTVVGLVVISVRRRRTRRAVR